jgi:hypothetical protein
MHPNNVKVLMITTEFTNEMLSKKQREEAPAPLPVAAAPSVNNLGLRSVVALIPRASLQWRTQETKTN